MLSLDLFAVFLLLEVLLVVILDQSIQCLIKEEENHGSDEVIPENGDQWFIRLSNHLSNRILHLDSKEKSACSSISQTSETISLWQKEGEIQQWKSKHLFGV